MLSALYFLLSSTFPIRLALFSGFRGFEAQLSNFVGFSSFPRCLPQDAEGRGKANIRRKAENMLLISFFIHPSYPLVPFVSRHLHIYVRTDVPICTAKFGRSCNCNKLRLKTNGIIRWNFYGRLKKNLEICFH